MHSSQGAGARRGPARHRARRSRGVRGGPGPRERVARKERGMKMSSAPAMSDQAEAHVGLRLSAGRMLALFAFGSIVITTLDGFHTWSDTTRYASPVVLRAAWWPFLTMGLAAAGG